MLHAGMRLASNYYMSPAYTFPFHTCEPRSSILAIAQPFSAGINLITAWLLVCTAAKSRSVPVWRCIVTFVAFELMHTVSHIYWHDSQRFCVHLLGYVMGFGGVLLAMRHLIQTEVGWETNCAIAAVTALDAVTLATTRAEGLAAIATGLLVIATIAICHMPHMPTWVRERFARLSAGVVLLLLVLANEMLYCEQMMEFAPLPYHLAVEVLGLLLFVYMATTFILWEGEVRRLHTNS